MAIKKLKTRLDLIQEEIDNQVHVVEDEKGNKVSNKSTSGNNIYVKGAQSILQGDIAPLRTSSKTFPTTTTKTTTKKDDDSLTSDLSLLSKSELLDMRKSLQDQLTNYDRKEKREWWDSDDNLLENLGNVFYKAFMEDQNNKYAEDEKYNALRKQYDDVWKAIEDKTVEEESKDLDALDKVWYTMGGGFTSGIEGINTSVDKVTSTILGRKPQEVRNISAEERLAAIAKEQTDGIAKVGLDLIGGISRQIPNMLIPSTTASSVLAFANFGGGAYEDAKRMGVSEEKATAYGVTIGGLELLLNKILPSYNINGQNVFGKTATGNLLNNVMGKISSNAFLRNTLTGAAGEFTEEYLQEFLDPIIRESLLEEDNNVGILNGKDAGEIAKNLASYTAKNFFSKENLYAGTLGALTSVAMGLPSNINAQQYEKATGRNIETGYTQNEQTVIDSLVNEKSSEIAKQKAIETEIKKAISAKETEQGGNLSTKEKTALTEAIKTKIEAGEIDVSNSKLSNKEITALREIVEEQMQQGQLDTNKIESILGNTITEQDSLLAKSYEETAKRSQNFTYDDTQITNVQEKAVYDSATKYLNDTIRSHEFVEKVAKIAKDKGTNYGFINNEELQSLGHDVEGKQVNGLVRTNQEGERTVLINIDSSKALNTIVGHETTHLLEGTQEYTELQEAIFNYAKEKGDFDARQKVLNSLYEGIENANIDSELTADLVGDYLFTESEFIESLSIQKPTVFQRLRELIDDLVVRFTGTKEEQQLREVQKKFKEAYRKNAQSIEGTQYSFAGVKGAKNSQNVLSRLDAAQQLEQEGNTNEEIRRKTGWFKGTDGQWRIEISDRDSKIAQQVKSNETYKLSEVLKHDKLYEAYPELKDYKVKFKDMKSNGGFNQLTSTISVNNKFTNDLVSLRGTLMHEVQHAIQKREGFARGTYYDAKNAENYKNSAGEQEARDVKSRLNYSKEQVKDIAPAMSKADSNRLHEVGLFSKKVEADQNIKYSLSEKGTLQDNNGNDVTLETSETGTHGDLMAIHNLSEEKLKGILELGGFPFPSIAITKPANISHENYGNISVLFDKNTIDPQANRKNKVYSRDAYTPRFPSVEYDIDAKVLKNIKNIVGDDYQNSYVSDAINLLDNLEDNLNRRGLEETLNNIKKDSSMKYVYMKSENPSFKELTKAEQYSKTYSNETLQRFLDNYDGKYPLNDIPSSEIDNYVPQMVAAYEEQLRQEFSKVQEFDAETINELVEAQTKGLRERFYLKDNFLTAATRLQKLGNNNQVIDTKATNELIDNTINQEAYNKWVDELFSGIIAKKGLRNNKDYFTPSGNKRTFDQLHYEYTLDNVVKIMTELDDTGSESTMMTGINEIAGNVSKRLTSIQDIKSNEYLLQSYSDEEYSAMINEYGDKLFNLQQGILDRGHSNSSNQFIAMDNLGTAIAEVARDYGNGKRVNANTITTALNEYGFNPTIEESQTILDMFDEFKELPTEYFEAKPKRAVRLNEVQAIVIPSDTAAEFKQQLQDAGLRYYEYDPNIEGDRQRVINQFDDLKFSLSQQGEQTTPTGDYNVYGEDVKLEQTIAPLQEEIKTLTETVQELKEQLAPVNEQMTEEVKEVEYTQPSKAELDNLMALQEKGGTEYANTFFELRDKYGQRKLYKGINEYKKAPETYEAPIKGDEFAPITETELPMLEKQYEEDFRHIDESNMPGEVEDIAPDIDNEITNTKSLFETRNYEDVGSRKVNAYQYDNPEVKPFFQEEAQAMLGDLKASIKGERQYNDDLYYSSGGEQGFYGTERQTTSDIAELLDGMDGKYKYTYADIEKGLNAIIKDEGSENNAVSKRIEFYLDQRLREGYTTVEGIEVPANQEYIKMLEAKEITDFYNNLPIDESLAPVETVEKPVENVSNSKEIAPIKKLEKSTTRLTEASTPESISKAYQLTLDGKAEKIIDRTPYKDIAEVLVNEPKTESDRNKRKWAIFKANVFDKGIVFEDLALKENNRELIAKWDYTLTSESRGQYAIGNGHNGLSKSLNDIRAEVENTGNTKDFYNYMYHKHNVDRMTLDKRFGVENKPVFGESVTAEQSQAIVNQYEKTHPEFIEFAQDVYDYVNADKQLLVDNGVISQEIADLWGKMYPHYVPTRRTTDTGIDINVPLDTRRTGINAPIKKATGGSSDILPLFDTMAMRTLQTYRATAKNSFGVELMNTLGTKVESNQINVDEVIDSIDTQDGLLQEGKKGKNPTFTVFENGEKATFEITKDMYDALRPVSESSQLSKTYKIPNVISNIRRGLLTEYNPTFMLTNAIKDVQDVLLNSQHAAKTYAKIPEAYKQIATKGYWYQEYVANGGERNSYFDTETNTFKTENKGLSKVLDLPPLSTISKINNFIEMSPRLAEYIASREAGRSIEVSMLDAARVTTNFKAGGDLTKFINRNGGTFLNASVQGAMQQVRNIREAKANGVRGWVNLATKFAVAGLPAILLNSLIWDDDDEYEELSDYVKQNYYIIGKTDDGTFIRIPKGRAVAVIQDALNQMENLVTGDDEVDLKSFIDLAINNLAPNNPLDNNVLSPIIQVAKNEAWYGGDLLPTRLQNLPAAEQYDESTDMLSRWIGETFNVSPYKVNYLIDQYSGGLGDLLLPMMTPEAESDADSILDFAIAPLRSKFTTNSTFNNQNVSDFYDLKEKLTVQANKSNATDEDALKNKYMNSVNAELSDLYEQKREIQNSDLSNSEKYKQAKEIQEQINELAKNALSEYTNVSTDTNYSTVGDREYYKRINSEGEVEWTKVDDEESADLDNLSMTSKEKNTYFKTKSDISEISKDTEDTDAKKIQIIDSILSSGMSDDQKAYLYGKHYSSEETLDKVTSSGISFDDFLTFSKESLSLEDTTSKAEYLYNADLSDEAKTVIYETSVLSGFDNEDKYKDYKVAKAAGIDINSWLSYKKQEFEADKDNQGNSISGTRKEKIISYINSLDLSIAQKAILIRQEYSTFREYNNAIVKYVDGLDISLEEKVSILEELDMTVDDNGNVYWK